MKEVLCPNGHAVTIRDSVCPSCGIEVDFRLRVGPATVVDLAEAFSSDELGNLHDEIWAEWERVTDLRAETDVEDDSYDALNDEVEAIQLLSDKVQEVQDLGDDLASAEDSHEIDLLSERLHDPETPDAEKEEILAYFEERIKVLEIQQMELMARPRMLDVGTWLPEEPPPGYRQSIWICLKCANGVYETAERGSPEWSTMPCDNCGHDNTEQLRELWQAETERADRESAAMEPLMTWRCVFHFSRNLKPVGTFRFFPDGTVKGGGEREADMPYRFKGHAMTFDSPLAFEQHVAKNDRRLELQRIDARPPFSIHEAAEPSPPGVTAPRATPTGTYVPPISQASWVSGVLIAVVVVLLWIALWAYNKSPSVCDFTGGYWIEPPATSQASPRCIRP